VRVKRPKKPLNKLDYLSRKEEARSLVLARLEHFNRFYNLIYKRVSVRQQRTRWGSCSRKGNLNFNYRLLDLPAEIADYIIVHELCHLKEFNHSRNFWNLVAESLPDYAVRRARLRQKPISN
jgi:hypothetical protein